MKKHEPHFRIITSIYLNCTYCNNIYEASKKDYLRHQRLFNITNTYCSVDCMSRHRKLIALDKVKVRFWSKVDKTPGLGPNGDCWIWTGHLVNGRYGQFTISRKPLAAHRASWTILNGSIPEGLVICHKCDNTKCVRPDHLFLGTHKDNQQDCAKKGRKKHGEEHCCSKLTVEKVIWARTEYKAGRQNLVTLSNILEVRISTIHRAIQGVTWKHVPMPE